MKKLVSSVIIFCIVTSCSLFGVAQMPQQPGRTVLMADGTEISAVTTDTISSKTSHEDDPITFAVDQDVVVDGATVIAKGTAIKGVVSNAKKSGYFGKGGQLNVRVESTFGVDGQKVKLRASKGKEGNDKTGTTVVLVVLFGPLGFLKKGKNAEIKAGSKIKVFTDEEKSIRVDGASPVEAKQVVPSTPQEPASPLTSVQKEKAPDSESTSSVAIKSTPDGADIEVDGKFVGSTPSTVRFPTGEHKIAVKKKGYTTWERTIMLSPGGNITVDVSLDKEAPPPPAIPVGGPPKLSTKPLRPAPER